MPGAGGGADLRILAVQASPDDNFDCSFVVEGPPRAAIYSSEASPNVKVVGYPRRVCREVLTP
jgi:hypothetical protein